MSELVKMILKMQTQNPNNAVYSTESYIAGLIAAANILSKDLQL